MNHLKSIFFIVIVICSLVSCGKKSNPEPSKVTKTSVYVVGNVKRIGGINAAVYWKDGVKVALADTTLFYSISAASAIAVSDTDVYIAGTVNFVATYWKNGKAVSLGSQGSYATAIAISGTDVYVAGIDGSNPVYWKNGVAVTLDNGGAGAAYADAIAVSGNNVYVAGHAFSLNGNNQIVFWKNGVFSAIGPSPAESSNYYANVNYNGWVNIGVSGTDVYITGTTLPFVATYWKNGIADLLVKSSTLGSVLNNITINGADVYVAGSLGESAVYWKNGALNTLPNGSQPSYVASGISISGSDVYVSGFGGYPNSQAVFWKNGSIITLANGPSYTTGIAVVSY